MEKYERSAIRIWTSQGFLNIGQAEIFYAGVIFIGFVYREIRQGLTDIEEMFKLLDQPPEIQDKPGAHDLVVKGPVIRFEDVPINNEPDCENMLGFCFVV